MKTERAHCNECRQAAEYPDTAETVHADPALYTTADAGAANPEASGRNGRIRPKFEPRDMHEIVRVPRRMLRTKCEGAGILGKTIWTSSIANFLRDPEINELKCGIWNDMSREASRLAQARGSGELRAPRKPPATDPLWQKKCSPERRRRTHRAL